MTAKKRSASKKSAARKSPAKEPEKDQGCRQVLSEYFELTGNTLEKQVDMCRDISKKIVEGKYTSEDAQKDWQEYVDRTGDYSREVTKLWFEGITRCTCSPNLLFPPGLGDLFGGDASTGRG